jgi:hypothetical protein
MALLRTLCWALIFILRLRFPPSSSLASKCNLISCSNNDSTQCDIAAENCAPCRRLYAFWANWKGTVTIIFVVRTNLVHLYDRQKALGGSGRKRQHEKGYKKARSTIWKTLALHTITQGQRRLQLEFGWISFTVRENIPQDFRLQ